TEHFGRQLWSKIAPGWRVTRPPLRPMLRAFHARVPVHHAPRVARDATTGPARPLAQQPLRRPALRARPRGACADAHARPSGRPARYVAAVAEPASRAGHDGTRPSRRRAVSAWHSERDETSSDIPCNADVHPCDGASGARGAGHAIWHRRTWTNSQG